jgi:cob(I)alamin adenosyltransferase
MKIYTRGGDRGTTSLLSGGRIAKDDPRLEAYGTLDELNSLLGVLLCESLPEQAGEMIRRIQGSLFAIGGALADANATFDHDSHAWDVSPLEAWIDTMDLDLPELKQFILPGGSRAAALTHLARTVCRRAERRVHSVSAAGAVPEGIIPFLNRLSDAFFVLARWLNSRLGIADPEWKPGTAC